MFRRSASLAIPHLKSFAAISSVSLVQLGHTNRSVFVVTRIAAWNCPRLGTFKTNSLLPTRRSGGRKMGLCFATFVFLTFRGPLASHDSNPYPNRTRIARYNATKGGNITPQPMPPFSPYDASQQGLIVGDSTIGGHEDNTALKGSGSCRAMRPAHLHYSLVCMYEGMYVCNYYMCVCMHACRYPCDLYIYIYMPFDLFSAHVLFLARVPELD